jgi:radical SAM superfamily enzyme YgiQ (UPF0313 family)
MIDVLLVVPPYYYKTKVLTTSVKEYAGVGYLTAVLREHGYNVAIIDADLSGFDVDQTVQAILEKPASIIGFTVLQVAAPSVVRIVKGLRGAGVRSHITIGGHFPTFGTEDIFIECPELDSIVRGEGENSCLNLVNALLRNAGDWRKVEGVAYRENGKTVINPPGPLISDLDTIPFPSRNTLKEVLKRGGSASIISSRGCYGNCAFCSVNAFYKTGKGPKWRGRSPGNLVDEIEQLVNEWGVHVFVFNDDNFIGPGKAGRERAYRIGEELIRRNLDIKYSIPAAVNDVEEELFGFLRTSGLRSVFLGIESMLQSQLELLNKHTTVEQNERAIEILEKLKIFYQIGFIMFCPNSTLEEVKYNLEYIRDKMVRNDYCGTQIFSGDLRILQGTSLEAYFKNWDNVRKERFYYAFTIKDMRAESLREIMDQIILKKTFHLLVSCKEEFMEPSWQRWIRTLICELQLKLSLEVIADLEAGPIRPEIIKRVIRDVDAGIEDIKAKMKLVIEDRDNDEAIIRNA